MFRHKKTLLPPSRRTRYDARGACKEAAFIGAVYLACVTLWAWYRMVAAPALAPLLPTGAIGSFLLAVIEACVKCCVFALPAMVIVYRGKSWVHLSFGRMFGWNSRALLWGGVLSLAFACWYGIRLVVTRGTVQSLEALTPERLLGPVIFAGLVEEIYFRGWLLNTLWRRHAFWIANAIAAVLFTIAHFPYWYLQGAFTNWWVLLRCLQVFATGLLLGLVTKKSNCVWGAVLAHSLHNLIVIFL